MIVLLPMKKKSHLILIIFILFVHCAAPVKNLYPPRHDISDNIQIYIIKYQWHTGIAFNRKEANPFLPLLKGEFSKMEFIEVGWGDKEYFMADKGTILLAIKAVLWPTRSVLHVWGFNGDPFLLFGASRVMEISISNQGFINMIQYINDSFAVDGDLQNIKLSKDSEGLSQYYLSKEKYHGFKTCNVWTARAIRRTGYPITPIYALSARNIFYQVKRNNDNQHKNVFRNQ